MAQTRNAQLELRLSRALREMIGAQRYQTWFVTTGARLEMYDDALVVRVKKDFYAEFISSTFGSYLQRIIRDVCGVERPIRYELDVDNLLEPKQLELPSHFQTSNVLQAQSPQSPLFPSSTQSDDYPAFPQRFPMASTSEAFQTSAPLPKRKRGRPRKSALPDESSEKIATDLVSPLADESLFLNAFAPHYDSGYLERQLRSTESDAPTNFAPTVAPAVADATPSYQQSVKSQPFLLAAPPKRKRGRPRKLPLTEQSATIEQTVSFADAYNGTLFQTKSDVAPAINLNMPTLSDEERAAFAVGDFGDLPDPPSHPTQRKRGRPKGSTNRRLHAPSETERDQNEVSRDANGYNIIQAPKENKPRVKADDSTRRSFASLRSFIVGPSNNMAYKIVELLLLEPSKMSPLYICGSTSVGKTHLLEGMCDAYSRKPEFATRPPLYMTAEQFTTAFIRSIQGGASFRDRFRNVSLFALDDIHFLEGKKSTQTELVYVLDFLRNRGVQVAISGNRPLRDIVDLREELVTRVEVGVFGVIAPPERETLAVILQRLAYERGISISEEVGRYVVSRFATHARELSGALNRLYVTHLATGAPITVELARQALADLAPVGYRNIRLEDVERVVQEAFSLNANALKSSSRAKKNADPRAIAMWLARKHTRAALAEIGSYFGGRRHSAVLSAQKKVNDWLHENASVSSADNPELPVAEVVKSLERSLFLSPRRRELNASQ